MKVPRRRHDNDIQNRKHHDDLIMVSDRHVDVLGGQSPEEIGISQIRSGLHVHVDRGAACPFNPGRRDERFAFPFAVPQIEIADLRHVARQQSQTVAASRDALRIAPPIPIFDPQRTEQPGFGIIRSAHPGQLGKNGGEKVRIAAVVVE